MTFSGHQGVFGANGLIENALEQIPSDLAQIAPEDLLGTICLKNK